MSPFGPIRKSRHVRFSTAYEGRPDVRQTRIGERARNKKTVMEDGNEGDCLGDQSRLWTWRERMLVTNIPIRPADMSMSQSVRTAAARTGPSRVSVPGLPECGFQHCDKDGGEG